MSNNTIYNLTGGDVVRRPFVLLLISVIIFALTIFVVNNSLLFLGAYMALLMVIVLIIGLYRKPILGIYLLLVYSFFWNVFLRNVWVLGNVQIPFGLGIDFLIGLTLIIAIYRGFTSSKGKRLGNSLILAACVWTFFCFLQLFNPASISTSVWFFTVRQYAFYFLFTIILVFLYVDSWKHFERLIFTFVFLSFLGGLWAIKQQHFGMGLVDNFMLQKKADTHILFGKIRIFSIFDNAGQAGITQGHAGVISTILFFYEKKFVKRLFYFLALIVCFYGMALSGTRGALAVPLIGLTTFILLSRRPRIIIIGFSLLATILYLLIFTTIGQSNYTINRMRSAFNSEDASFQYRLKARESYADYLNEKPFGWGLGSAGYWGQRFSGDENTMGGTDGGYVMIHAETGIIGLVLYSSFLFFIMSYALVKLVKMKNSPNRIYLLSLWCSLLGLIIANYGNSVIFQLPESIFVPISFALMWSNFSSQVLEKHSFED